MATAIRYKVVEGFANIEEDLQAEPHGNSQGYCTISRGDGILGDCCNSEKKYKGCLKDSALKCGIQKVEDVDEQRIYWAKGEKCVDER